MERQGGPILKPLPAGPKSKYLLYASFGLLLAVLTALIALGLARIESFNHQIHTLTEAQGRKIGTVSELFLSNGQRSALIDKLFGAETAQARKTAHEQYLRAIEVYTRAVEKLSALQVDPSERFARSEAIAAAARARAIGEDIVGLLMKGEIARASELNLTQAVLEDSRFAGDALPAARSESCPDRGSDRGGERGHAQRLPADRRRRDPRAAGGHRDRDAGDPRSWPRPRRSSSMRRSWRK